VTYLRYVTHIATCISLSLSHTHTVLNLYADVMVLGTVMPALADMALNPDNKCWWFEPYARYAYRLIKHMR